MRKCKLALLLALCFPLASCFTFRASSYERPERFLTHASKPIRVLSVSSQGSTMFSATFIDASGRIFTIQSDSFASLCVGDVITRQGVTHN